MTEHKNEVSSPGFYYFLCLYETGSFIHPDIFTKLTQEEYTSD